jgi:hypothetical protein
MNVEILKNIKEMLRSISSLFIFLFIYLIFRDIIEATNFGFSIDDIRYILSFETLIYTSASITSFFLLIYTLANKGLLNYCIIFISFILFLFLSEVDTLEKFFYFVVIIIIFLKHKKIYNELRLFGIYIDFALLILFFIIFLSISVPRSFEQIRLNNKNEPEFLYHKNAFGRLIEPKFFSPAELEKSYDFVEFKNSKIALYELKDIITNDEKLPYFGFDGKFWVWFMQNSEKYRVFFVLKDNKLTTIVTMILENNKFQIIKYLSKDVNFKKSGIYLESMSGL